MANQNHRPSGHQRIETSNFLMIVLILLTVAVGGIVEIVPLFFQKSTTQPVEGLKGEFEGLDRGAGRLRE